MAGTTISQSNNGIQAGTQALSKSSSERQAHKAVGDLGKALQANDAAAAQAAVTALKTAAPTQNGRTDFQNAVKALDESVKAGDLKSAREAFANLQQAQRRSQQAPARQVQAQQPPAPPPAPPAPAPAPTPAQNTQQIAQADQEKQARQQAEQAFITRQELAAASAQASPPAQLGQHIDTTA